MKDFKLGKKSKHIWYTIYQVPMYCILESILEIQ